MVRNDELLIAVDPGHGGWDNGASFEGRLEKNDNLRLGLQLQKELLARGVRVLMTRDSDVFVNLADRAAMANEADADLFISLHRNSYIEQTPLTNGVENFIYLTAPEETAGRAARLVLDHVVSVGVQADRGVQRGNYYVLRRTIMPAMLLEMGYIINETDNRLFDENLGAYAAAIADGIMEYFGVCRPESCEVPPFPSPEEGLPCECCICPACPSVDVWEAQRAVNERFGLDMPISGFFDDSTIQNMVKALQKALNMDFSANLLVDGILGPQTLAALPNVFPGSRGNVVFVIQALLKMHGYQVGNLDGIFGPITENALHLFQRDHLLPHESVVRHQTMKALLGMLSLS